MVEALRGGWTPDAADALIEGIDEQARSRRAAARSRAVRLSWVTLPEPMAVEETADGAPSARGAAASRSTASSSTG